MAGTTRVRAGKQARKSRANKKAFSAALAVAKSYDLPRAHGVTTVDVLQECLERVVAIMRYAAKQLDRIDERDLWAEILDAQGNVLVEPNQWLALEAAMRAEAIELSVQMENLGIAERQVALAERTADQIAPILMDVLEGLGLTAAQKRKVPGVVRARLQVLEGGQAA